MRRAAGSACSPKILLPMAASTYVLLIYLEPPPLPGALPIALLDFSKGAVQSGDAMASGTHMQRHPMRPPAAPSSFHCARHSSTRMYGAERRHSPTEANRRLVSSLMCV